MLLLETIARYPDHEFCTEDVIVMCGRANSVLGKELRQCFTKLPGEDRRNGIGSRYKLNDSEVKKLEILLGNPKWS